MDTSLNSILEAELQQGIWAALYIYLFFRMLKESAAREAKYQSMIEMLSGNIQKGIEKHSGPIGCSVSQYETAGLNACRFCLPKSTNNLKISKYRIQTINKCSYKDESTRRTK